MYAIRGTLNRLIYSLRKNDILDFSKLQHSSSQGHLEITGEIRIDEASCLLFEVNFDGINDPISVSGRLIYQESTFELDVLATQAGRELANEAFEWVIRTKYRQIRYNTWDDLRDLTS